MDFTPVTDHLFRTFWFLIPLMILVFVLKTAWFKGRMGEFLVNTGARLFLSGDYHLIRDITLETPDGTTQIDHVIISPYGIFVIETKNMKGWIFGSEKERYWTQKIYRHTSRFQNPLRQNYRHVKALEALLRVPEEAIHSLIVFVGDSRFKTEMPENVTYTMGYVRYIKSRRERLLSEADVNSAIKILEGARLRRGFATNRIHVGHLRKKPNQSSLPVPKCPRCGGDMVKRKARKGKHAGEVFWGCMGFPNCRGIVRHH